MSKFFSKKYSGLEPYTPGEQPKERKYIKLNTNESPFPPSEKAVKNAEEAAKRLQLYSDPECTELVKMICELYSINKNQVLFTNGSDEILNFAFMAFCDKECKAVFPDITYGFYKVFAQLNNVPYEEIPLEEDFTIDIKKYFGKNRTVFIANPNAPTGIALKLPQIEEILENNKDNVVVIDEAYVDFCGESALKLVNKYDNLLVTQTFSKSRSMAGARLGFGIASPEIIKDLVTIKYSTNPYNINSMTMAAGIGSLSDNEYTLKNCKIIAENREYVQTELKELGFEVTNSKANFVFAKHNKVSGEEIYRELREKGILVRHFNGERIKEYNRITIGNKEQMQSLIKALTEIIKTNER